MSDEKPQTESEGSIGQSASTAGFDPGHKRRHNMSSARKRAAIQKANNEAAFQRQRAMRAEHHANVMQGFAEAAARRGDVLYAAIQKHQAETRYAEVSNTLALADRALYEALKVGAGDTVPMGSNVSSD